MSKILVNLVGKDCDVIAENLYCGKSVCKVIDVDEDWMTLEYKNKKNELITTIIRVDSIKSIALVRKVKDEDSV